MTQEQHKLAYSYVCESHIQWQLLTVREGASFDGGVEARHKEMATL